MRAGSLQPLITFIIECVLSVYQWDAETTHTASAPKGAHSHERVALKSKLRFKNTILLLDRNTDVLTMLKSTVLANL